MDTAYGSEKILRTGYRTANLDTRNLIFGIFLVRIGYHANTPSLHEIRLSPDSIKKTYHEQLKVKLKFTTSTSLKCPTTTSSTIGVKHFLMKSKKENFKNLTKTICKNSTSCNAALCSMLLTISRLKKLYPIKI